MIYLFLNDISTGEVIVIMAFILMFFGSKGLPGMARSLGKGLRHLRDATDDIKRDIRHSVEDIEKTVKSNMDGVDIVKDVTDAQADIQKNIDNIVKRPSRFVKDNIKDFKDSVEVAGGSKKKVVKKEEVKEPVKSAEDTLNEKVEIERVVVDNVEEGKVEVDLSQGKSKKEN